MAQPRKTDINVLTKSRNECPVIQVTIYKDRAQVTRQCEAVLTEGIQELHITDFVDIEKDSIRVEGKGGATIAEVSFQSKSVCEEDVMREGKEKELTTEQRALIDEKYSLQVEAKKDVIKRETKLLDEFFNKAARCGIAPGSQDATGVELTDPYLKGVREYMTEYRTLSHSLISDFQKLEDQERELDKGINVINKRLHELRDDAKSDENCTRECVIVLDSPKDTKIQLTISYVVHSASWIPSYDLRMFTDQGKLQLFYYGLISQSSGEDWNDTKIFLSTAEPSFGGNIPRVPLTELRLYQPPPKQHVCSLYDPPSPKRSSISIFRRERSKSLDVDDFEEKSMDVAEVKAVDKTTSTSYEIARQSSIPSDNTPHKVTVAILDFEPDLSYVTVPKASPNAFLQAKVVNTSPYMLLAGESSIFLDNSFVAKAHLKSAAPKEEFKCSLGVDPIVRVDYKPIIKMKSSSGIFTKTETTLYEQVIEVKNLHDKTINIQVKDSLPTSDIERIKVTLISPEVDAKHPEKNTDARLTKYNGLSWLLSVASMATKEVVLKYSIEMPSHRILEEIHSYVDQDK